MTLPCLPRAAVQRHAEEVAQGAGACRRLLSMKAERILRAVWAFSACREETSPSFLGPTALVPHSSALQLNVWPARGHSRKVSRGFLAVCFVLL